MLSNIIKILATVVEWLLSPEMRKKRHEDETQETSEEIREDVNSSNTDAVSTRIDKLLTKASNRAERSKDGED